MEDEARITWISSQKKDLLDIEEQQEVLLGSAIWLKLGSVGDVIKPVMNLLIARRNYNRQIGVLDA